VRGAGFAFPCAESDAAGDELDEGVDEVCALAVPMNLAPSAPRTGAEPASALLTSS